MHTALCISCSYQSILYPFIITNLSVYKLTIFIFHSNAHAILLLEPNQSVANKQNKQNIGGR